MSAPTGNGQATAPQRSLTGRQHKKDVVKNLAFVSGLCIGAVGGAGIIAPSSLVT